MTTRLSTFEEYQAVYQQSVAQPEAFWAQQASQFQWRRPWDRVVEWSFDPYQAQWFLGGQLNITENCLDRHLATRPDQTAILWEPNDPNEPARHISYRELHAEVCRFANALRQQGVQKGDRVCIYMPMVPALAVATLACARIGAIHSVVFAGFSATSLADRINDAACKLVLTSDGNYRGAKQIPVKAVVDDAVPQCPTIERVIVLRHTGQPVTMTPGRDLWWHEALEGQSSDCPAETMDAEDPLFILYTSGSTGKPKGVVHACGGYMVYTAYSFQQVFQYEPGDIHFCTADVGWITGHSYIIYGPLLSGATSLMFEGVPTYPSPARFWEIVQKHRVNILYTAPTAIRALMVEGDHWTEGFDFSSLKVLGSVGEPINEEAWHWYQDRIGQHRTPIVDTWWQTETGGIMISPIAFVTPLKPCFATLPLPGIQPVLLDPSGHEIEGNNVEGLLAIKYPWPSMVRTTYGDHDRCFQNYFAPYRGYYFTGDAAKRDEDGYYRIIGRVDDVINVSGHRIGTAEVENAVNEHPLVIETAIVGYPHPIKGQGIYAYVISLPHDTGNEDSLRTEIVQIVAKMIGPIAKPDLIQFVPGLPKTRSGKIMRRILRKIAENDTSNLGDTSTLLDPSVVDIIMAGSLVK